MQLTINTNLQLDETLNNVASADNVTPEIWVERKINALLFSAMKQEIMSKVSSSQNPEDLASFKEAISPVVEAISIRESAAATTESPKSVHSIL